ncbi:MAG: cytochrome c oxidase assembly protein [Dehalococcoidia bacterium]
MEFAAAGETVLVQDNRYTHAGDILGRAWRARVMPALPIALAALWPLTALAHDGASHPQDHLSHAWNWQPEVLAGVAVSGGLYGRGVRALWHRAGTGRGIAVWRTAAFGGGLLGLLVALVSPVDSLGVALFSVHMVQHLLLVLVAAPLLILGEPVLAGLWALPRSWRRALGATWREAGRLRWVWRGGTAPPVTWLIHAGVLWCWHLPRLFDATLSNGALHALEHAMFLGTAVLWWWSVAQTGRRRRLGYGVGLLAVFTMGVQGGALGALLAFARRPWYPTYAGSTAAWGLSPLQDQQLAGLIMWAPAGGVYMIAAAVLFTAWLRAAERRAHRAQRHRR